MSDPFDPLAVENVGVILAAELFEQPANYLPMSTSFPGAGIYALYYNGPDPLYTDLVRLDRGRSMFPIYIGSAARENTKQGFTSRPTSKSRIYNRIRTHQSSIAAAGLSPRDFSVRYLVLNDAYITLAESVLIAVFRPVWNGMGLGSNGVGGPRMSGDASLWDAAHSGRPGRPVGDEGRRAEAKAHIAMNIARIASDYDDPRTKRMADRIMRFVRARFQYQSEEAE